MNIKGYELTDEIIMEIGRFTILWNCFERENFNNNCSLAKIKENYKNLYISKEAQHKLADVLKKRSREVRQLIPDYVNNGLYPGNAHQSKKEDSILMRKFIEQKDEDLCCGCLLVIHRIRNNLMHGLKLITELNKQLELFQAVNGVLESIEQRKMYEHT